MSENQNPLSMSKRVALFFRRIGSIFLVISVAIGCIIFLTTPSWHEGGEAIGLSVLIGFAVQILFNMIGWAVSALFPD